MSIPIAEAHKLLSMAVSDCARRPVSSTVMLPMVKYVAFHIGGWEATEIRPNWPEYPVIAALADYYDSMRPNWRTE